MTSTRCSRSTRLAAVGAALCAQLWGCGSIGVTTNQGANANASNPLPSVSSISPQQVAAGSPALTLTVTGSDFVAGSTAVWNGTALPTTYVSATELSVSVPPEDVGSTGTVSLTVVSPAPGGGTSNAANVTVTATNPVPSISSISPTSAAVGSGGFNLVVSGSDFVAGSSVHWNGRALTTKFSSASRLTANVHGSMLGSAGTASVTVVNPAPGGGVSNSATFTIGTVNPLPSVSALSPVSASAGSATFALTVTGSDFVASSVVHWNGAALTSTFVSSTQLSASVPAADLLSAGSASVTVVNPGPGGGTSNAATFTITPVNPLPSISSITPASAGAGSTAVTVTVNGSDFVAASVVQWNGVALSTSFLASTRLSALIPASDLTSAGSASVTVVNPAPGGGTSNAATFTITPVNPVPSVSSLSPSSASAGSTAVTVTVSGSDFLGTSVVNWNGTPLSTSYVSSTALSALIPASDLTVAGAASVTVVNPAPGGGTSNAATFTITPVNPAPSVSSLSPSSASAGSTAVTLTVNGSDFVASSAVQWNGVALTTTYLSSTALSALIPASDLVAAGSASVTVVNPAPGGGTSNAATFTITAVNPVPSISSLSPASASAGSTALTLTVNGSDFVAASVIDWNGAALATAYVSSAVLTATVPASALANTGSASVTVVNPAPGGGTSNAATFTITAVNPVPSISSLSPASASAGSTALTLTVNGSDFVAASVIAWNGAALATAYVSSTVLTATVPASALVNTGSASVTVVNPAPGGGTSNAATFTITAVNPVPSISSLSPASASAGSAGFMLSVSGSNFIAASVVNWNGVALATTYVSSTALSASVPASDLANTGSASVTVVSPAPGGGTSNAATFTITPVNPLPSISSISPATAAAGSTAFTLTVNGSGFVAASSVEWNGSALTTSYVSAGQITALVPASDLTGAGSASVTVANPAPGGGTSNTATFTITPVNPVPSVSSISPSSANAGSTAVTVTVNGSGFVASSVVEWNASALTSSYVSATQLTALIPASDLTSAGSASVTVANPAPGGGTSNAAMFTITAVNPAPAITSISPASATAGSGAITLTVNGSGFVAASSVEWNGVALATTYVSAAQLSALIAAADLTTAGTATVTVSTPAPGGGTSNGETFTINPASAGAYIRQSAQYMSYPGANSSAWNVTLSNVQAGSTIYVVGTWPNFVNTYPTMAVHDGTNSYTLLDRYDDRTLLNHGIQGTQSLGHWYAANVPAGTYTINMSPSPGTWEDWVGVVAFEVAGVSSTPLDGHALTFQGNVAPGSNTLSATVSTTQSTGILMALTFDDVDATAPTAPLLGTGFTAALGSGPLWDFTKSGKPSAAAEYQAVSAAGSHSATFSPQEGGGQYPDYMTAAVVFH